VPTLPKYGCCCLVWMLITSTLPVYRRYGNRFPTVLVFHAPGHIAAEFHVPDSLSTSELANYRRKVRDVMAGASGEEAGA
jgi:hypothetical protein